MSGYRAVIVSAGGFLLGGVKKQVSSVLQTKKDAVTLAQTMKEINEGAGNKVARAYVIKSKHKPELYRKGGQLVARKNPRRVSRVKRNPVDFDFDSMDPEELLKFWYRYQKGRFSKELFPEGGKNTRRATADLANYAANIATAKNARLGIVPGGTATALEYERIADSIYERLPDFARW